MRRSDDWVSRPEGCVVSAGHGREAATEYELVSLTSVIDSRAHMVTDVELSSPHAMRTGRYEALCGHLIAPAPLIEPDGARCRRCDELDRALRPAASRRPGAAAASAGCAPDRPRSVRR